jgi:predicted glycosyltransferase
MRILLYNSAARGTGQYVRSMKIAEFITSFAPDSSCRILAGNSVVERSLPRNTDVVALPQIFKSLNGAYSLRACEEHPFSPASASLKKAFAVRRQIIDSTIDSYAPDIFLVDSRPGGLAGELMDPLSRVSSSRCKSVLLLRDIVDAPRETVRRWQEEGVYSLIRTLYDSVVFLGEQSFFDALVEYRLQLHKGKVCHVGFLGNPGFDIVNSMLAPQTSKRRVLVTVGGGFDGSGIIKTVCDLLVDKAENIGGLAFTIVLGANSPLTGAQIRQHVKSADPHVEVVTYVSDLTSRIAEADLVISMCGYNTMFELIEAQKKVIAVPRGHSGYEQTLRARLLSRIYDGLWVIPQNEFSPKRLGITIADALEAPPPQVRIPMNGASNLIAHLVSLVPR